jgi:predicted DCC family thiol-disulfide oxidoreductase YuxK
VVLHRYIILYDGVCRLCNRLNRFVLNRDAEGKFQFASLQSRFAKEVLAKHSEAPLDLNTVYLVTPSSVEGEQVLSKARAVLRILKQIGGVWSLARLLGVLPTFLLDFGYDLVARHRYRIFGKLESCPLPDPKYQDRFIDI